MDETSPKEKVVKYGLKSLTNPEILSIILDSSKGESIEKSKMILQKYSLNQIQKMSPSQIMREFNLSLTKACQIIASIELSERVKIEKKEEKIVSCAEDISKILLPQVQSLSQEYLFVVYLNTRKKIICEKTLFIGSLNESLISPREIFKHGLDMNASAIILAHNHPSGNSTPSEADIESTKELIKIGKIMGIEVIDHIILGKDNYWSLCENGFI